MERYIDIGSMKAYSTGSGSSTVIIDRNVLRRDAVSDFGKDWIEVRKGENVYLLHPHCRELRSTDVGLGGAVYEVAQEKKGEIVIVPVDVLEKESLVKELIELAGKL